MTKNDIAIFAGGCFWCLEPVFSQLAGVKKVESGYIGGYTENPSYKQVRRHHGACRSGACGV